MPDPNQESPARAEWTASEVAAEVLRPTEDRSLEIPDGLVMILASGFCDSEAKLMALRERIRVKACDAYIRTTEGRDTYADGYHSGLITALEEFAASEEKATE